jgi:hypothetical protein
MVMLIATSTCDQGRSWPDSAVPGFRSNVRKLA